MIPLIRRAFAHAPSTSPWNDRDPIRAELFSVERLEEHARSLAAAQSVTPKVAKGNPLGGRLVDNEAVLLHAYRTIAKARSEERAITPAAEWLIDNYHVVEKQIRDIRSDLPPGYYRQLPKLAEGPFAGYPRVLGVAWAFCFAPALASVVASSPPALAHVRKLHPLILIVMNGSLALVSLAAPVVSESAN